MADKTNYLVSHFFVSSDCFCSSRVSVILPFVVAVVAQFSQK